MKAKMRGETKGSRLCRECARLCLRGVLVKRLLVVFIVFLN